MTDDSFLWLEDVHGSRALDWVQSENRITLSHFQEKPLWKSLHQEALGVFTHPSKLAFGTVHQGFVYHLHQDTKNRLGLWRRTPLAGMKPGPQAWESLLDLDVLSAKEGLSFFLMDVTFENESPRCLLQLSEGGKDACQAREFDLETKAFVQDGFVFPESKSTFLWDGRDTVYWASSFQRSTKMGYPSQVYRCERGQDLSEAQLIHEIPVDFMTIWLNKFGYDKDQKIAILVYETWDHSHPYLLENLNQGSLGTPAGCYLIGRFQSRWVVFPEKGWDHFPPGSLLIEKEPNTSTPFNSSNFVALFTPTEKHSVQEAYVLKTELFFRASNQLQAELWRIDSHFQRTQIPLPPFSQVVSLFGNCENSQAFINLQSFTTAPQILECTGGALKTLQKTEELFDSQGVETFQYGVRSKDGTEIPYFVVRPPNSQGQALPTLQYGYGGFMLAQFPSYLGAIGKLWIEKGGSYVLSNIRGGSEFGPLWHQQALKENRMKCYEDFIAISEDLIARGLTTPAQLGIQGRSNGGLLTGAVMTLRPDLYNAALIEVPLLDMLRYAELPPGSSWIWEYGDPQDPKIREVILKYSPYQNLKKNVRYPKAFLRTVRTDDRVHPGHARKMAALMKSWGHDCWFWEEETGGHGSHTMADKAFQTATVFAYLHEQLK